MLRNCSLIFLLPLSSSLAETKLIFLLLIYGEEVSQSQGSFLLQVLGIQKQHKTACLQWGAQVSIPGCRYGGHWCSDEVNQVPHGDCGWLPWGHALTRSWGKCWCMAPRELGSYPKGVLFPGGGRAVCWTDCGTSVHLFCRIYFLASLVVCMREIIILSNENAVTGILSLTEVSQQLGFLGL